jgi:hypothetical protein
MKAFYPFVGGVSTSHRYNLIDARNVDAAYYLDFIGGVTHNSNGVIFNGSTGYANTKMLANILSLNNTHIGANVVSNNAGTYTGFLLGSNVTSRLWLAPSFDATNAYFQANNNTITASTKSTSIGLWLLSRTTSTNEIAYLNGAQYVNKTANSTALDTGIIYIGARNNGANITNYLNVPLNCVSIGEGFTDTQVTNFRNAITSFNTTLGR